MYGMGFRSRDWQPGGITSLRKPLIERVRREFLHNGDKLLAQLPTNRDYFNRLKATSA